MGKKEQAPALAIFVQGSLWVWSATSRGRPPDGGLALAVFHMVPRVPAAPNLFVHPPADLRKVLLPPSSRPARLLRLTVFCPASSGDGSSIVGRGRRPPRASSQRSLGGRCRLVRLRRPRVCPALVRTSFCFVITGASPLLSPLLSLSSCMLCTSRRLLLIRVSTTLKLAQQRNRSLSRRSIISLSPTSLAAHCLRSLPLEPPSRPSFVPQAVGPSLRCEAGGV